MASPAGTHRRLREIVDGLIGLDGLPEPEGLPRYVAPLPRLLEDVGLRLAWPIAAVNVAGTAFGFWYYRFQFADTPLVAWPVVPDSPMATLFIGLSLALWKLGRTNELVNALAFYGCIKLGGWTPFVQLVVQGQGSTPLWLYQFLIWSHLAMVVEAFLIHRYSRFPVWAVGAAMAWYLFNDVVDYFVPIVGDPHHTLLNAELVVDGGRAYFDHSLPAHDLAAAAAVVLTVVATFLALATRVEKLERRRA
jgi:uncharacterized membrane protein YpjA